MLVKIEWFQADGIEAANLPTETEIPDTIEAGQIIDHLEALYGFEVLTVEVVPQPLARMTPEEDSRYWAEEADRIRAEGKRDYTPD